MKPLLLALTVALVAAALPPSAARAQTPLTNPTVGVDCGCTKTGEFDSPRAGKAPAAVAPALDPISDSDALSPGGTYRLHTEGVNAPTLSIRANGTSGPALLTLSLAGESKWGFSPDDDRFAVWSLHQGTLTVSLYDLTKTGEKRVWLKALTVGAGETPVLFSPKGHYLLAVGAGSTGQATHVVSRTGDEVVSRDFPAGAFRGFSPNDHLFVVWTADGPNLTTRLFDLRTGGMTSRTSAGANARVQFSPNGRYLLTAALPTPTSFALALVDSAGALRHSVESTFFYVPGEPGDAFGAAAWGFGPDKLDRAFVYEFNTTSSGGPWRLVNLARPRANAVVRERTLSPIASFWTFSPCGDAAALVEQTGSVRADLYRTADGASLLTRNASTTNVFVRATAANLQVVENGTTAASAANRAALACPAPPVPVTLSTVAVAPASARGGAPVAGTVTLSAAAPEGGVGVALSLTGAGAGSVEVPDEVTVDAGKTTATFAVTSVPVLTARTVTVRAALGGTTRTAALTITPPALARVVADTVVVSGDAVNGFVELDAPAPADSLPVALASSHPAVLAVPAGVRVAGDETRASFTATAGRVGENVRVTLTGSWNGAEKTLVVRVRPAELETFAAASATCSVYGGDSDVPEAVGGGRIRMRVKLDGLPPVGGALVALASSHAAASGPASVVVDPGAEAFVTFTTARVAAPTPVTLTATYRGASVLYHVVLIPPPVEFVPTDLGPGEARRANEHGQVLAGGFLNSRGHLRALSLPDAPFFARDVNAFGEVAGSAGIAPAQAAVWTDTLRVLLGPNGDVGAAYAINEAGLVAGWSGLDDLRGQRPTVWEGGVATALAMPAGTLAAHITALSDAGHAAGNGAYVGTTYLRSLLWSTLLEPGTVLANTFGLSQAEAVNAAGTVVGAHSGWGAVWPLDGDVHQTTMSHVFGINDGGFIVGTLSFGAESGDPGAEDRGPYAMLGMPDGREHNLSCLLAEPLPSGSLSAAFDITEAGHIVARGEGSSGVSHGYLLTPRRTGGPDVRAAFEPGAAQDGLVTRRLAVTNAGAAAAHDVVVEARLPHDAVVVVEEGAGCTRTGRRVACPVGTLAPGATTGVTFTVPAGRPASYALVAGARHAGTLAAGGDDDLRDNLAVDVVVIRPAAVAEHLADLGAGQAGAVGTGSTGLGLTFTDPSETAGALTIRRYANAPVGNDALLTLTVQTAGGAVEAERVATDRYWTVEAAGLSGFAYRACLDVTGMPGVSRPDRLVVVKRATAADAWRPLDTVLETDGVRTLLCAGALASFSEFGVGFDESNALPVELTGFTARADGGAVVLAWTTASETNNAGFAIEAQPAGARPDGPGSAVGNSADRTSGAWSEIGFVRGHGTTAEARAYGFRAGGLAPGRYSFRLRQVDFDGTAQYSALAEAALEAPRVLALGAPRPNPARGRATLAFTVPTRGRATVIAYDALGREVARLFDDEAEGGVAYAATLDGASLAPGIYFVRVAHGGRVQTQRVALVR